MASKEKAPDGHPWPLPRIAVDTREQRPWRWGKLYSGEADPDSLVTTLLDGPWYSETATLGEGDYQLLGPDGAPLEGVCAVERKSMADLRGSLSAGHDRFLREMERLAPWSTPVVIVEGPIEVLLGSRSGLVEMLDSARARFLDVARMFSGQTWVSDLARETAAMVAEVWGVGPVHAALSRISDATSGQSANAASARAIAEAIGEALGHEREEAQRPGRVSVRSLLGTVLSILVDHRVPVLFLPSRDWAEYAAAWILRRAWRRWLVDEPGRLELARGKAAA